MKLKHFLILLVSCFLFSGVLHAQSLEDELDALEESEKIDERIPIEEAVDVDEDLLEDDFEEDIEDEIIVQEEAIDEDLLGEDEDEPVDEMVKAPMPSESFTGGAAEETATLEQLEFFQLADRVRVAVAGSRTLEYEIKSIPRRQQVILELKNTMISKALLRKVLDTGEFDGPVALIQAFDSMKGSLPVTKILIQLRSFYEPTLSRGPGKIYIDFPVETSVVLTKKDEKLGDRLIKVQSQSKAGIPKTFLTVREGTVFTGRKINLKLKDAKIKDVLELLADVSGKNFILTGPAEQKITINVKDTPWDQLFSIILLNAKLGYQEIGNTYRIAPIFELKQEIDLAADSQKKLLELAPLITKLIPVNYAKAQEILVNIDGLKSERGKVTVDARTNALLITDTIENLDIIEAYVESIDRQTPLVLIEARIVLAEEEVSRSFGFEWTIEGDSPNPGGTKTTTTTGNSSVTSPANWNLLFTNLGGFFNSVNLTLNALETENLVKTLANPRITVLNNKTAKIRDGQTTIVITETAENAESGNVIATTAIEGVLELDVTPQVSSDGYVLLKINLKKDIIVNAQLGTVETKEISTELLVESGKTAVIGGIYTLDDTDTITGWTFLKDIPILGWLFTPVRKYTDKKTELLMFISPRILNAEKSLINRGLIGGSKSLNKQNTATSNNGGEAI